MYLLFYGKNHTDFLANPILRNRTPLFIRYRTYDGEFHQTGTVKQFRECSEVRSL